MQSELRAISDEVITCHRCPRLVEWRQRVATDKRASFATEEYWGRPVPGFGDNQARMLIVGLAPAAHGGNRTGRVFTGDRSGEWLFASLYRLGFANQPVSVHRDDGLRLRDAYIAAAVRCAPPQNKPTVEERARCRPYLTREMTALERLRTIVALGSVAWDTVLTCARELGWSVDRPKPRFGHEAVANVGDVALIGSYHPSQQNTFTGKLTEAMLDSVFARARKILGNENRT